MHFRICVLRAMVCCFLANFSMTLADEQASQADLILRGGMLHVGDGQPAQRADLAITGDQIVAVGDLSQVTAKRVIDCTDLVICPGFIDLHNHSDTAVTRSETRAVMNYLTQGCTTIVTGNCGSGPVDVGAYYAKLKQFGAGVNVAHLLPQGNLRREIMGSERRKPTAEELGRMREITDKAMQDGAWGMSTGLIYVPSSYAETAEIIEIAQVVARYDGLYASHIRNEGRGLLDAVEEALKIGQQAGLPIHISHFKSSGKDSWGLVRTAVEVIRKQREAGQVVTADQYPYTASSTSLGATFIPAWARAGGRQQMLRRLEQADDAERIRAAITKKLAITDQGQRIQIASYRPHPEWAGQRLKAIADREGVSPLELILQIEREGGASVVNHSINEQDVRFVMTQAWVATASDGSARIPRETVPHPRSYGTFARKLGHYAIRQEALALPLAIRSCSGLPADILRLPRRGYLRTGYFADICVFDPDELSDLATFDRPHQYSVGVRHLWVNGTQVIADARPTGALPGRPLRHATPDDLNASSTEATGAKAGAEQ